ncbi:MAG TPA: NAD-dependent epimerase/dehydratase family protein [Pseudohongiella sp.]|nr:NAD-dependent epimerase/dehydratase family protein [Pseudohongiella sp.]
MSGVDLVTGGTGFVGRQLVELMRSRGQNPRLLQRPQHDLLNPATLAGLCEGVDTVYHLAAYAHVNQAQTRQLYAINVDGTRNLLNAAIAAGVRHFVYVSSVLADPAYDSPRTAYGDSKQRAEQLLLDAHRAGGIRVSIIRPVNVYGPGMKGNLMSLFKLIRKGLLPSLPDFGQAFSLIGVDDLCEGILRVGQQEQPEARIYTLSDGHDYTIKAVEAAMRQQCGRKQSRWNTPRWLFFIAALVLEVLGRLLPVNNAPGLRSYRALARNYTVDSTASWEQLGYNPRSSFFNQLPRIAEKD